MQSNNMTIANRAFNINTGSARSVSGFAVSGTVAAGLIAGVHNVQQAKEGKIVQKEAVKNTAIRAAQGGLATATAISVANTLGNPNKSIFSALGALMLGAGAIYALEKLNTTEDKE